MYLKILLTSFSLFIVVGIATCDGPLFGKIFGELTVGAFVVIYTILIGYGDSYLAELLRNILPHEKHITDIETNNISKLLKNNSLKLRLINKFCECIIIENLETTIFICKEKSTNNIEGRSIWEIEEGNVGKARILTLQGVVQLYFDDFTTFDDIIQLMKSKNINGLLPKEYIKEITPYIRQNEYCRLLIDNNYSKLKIYDIWSRKDFNLISVSGDSHYIKHIYDEFLKESNFLTFKDFIKKYYDYIEEKNLKIESVIDINTLLRNEERHVDLD